jgi:tRNA(Ile2) C34 agmatinyltransferase TiaS
LRPEYELSQVIDRFGNSFVETYRPNAYVQRILRAIRVCRTEELGWHKDRCDQCGHIRISYNSCRNRHCPKCQNTQREAWIENRKRDLLPVPYFHVVFTVPVRGKLLIY